MDILFWVFAAVIGIGLIVRLIANREKERSEVDSAEQDPEQDARSDCSP